MTNSTLVRFGKRGWFSIFGPRRRIVASASAFGHEHRGVRVPHRATGHAHHFPIDVRVRGRPRGRGLQRPPARSRRSRPGTPRLVSTAELSGTGLLDRDRPRAREEEPRCGTRARRPRENAYAATQRTPFPEISPCVPSGLSSFMRATLLAASMPDDQDPVAADALVPVTEPDGPGRPFGGHVRLAPR